MAKREMPKKKDMQETTYVPVTITDSDVLEPIPESTIGVVTDCIRLNVRRTPDIDGDIVCEVKALSNLMINLDESTDDWYRVYTETGFEGYCMKKYVHIPMSKED